jgi:hypothetical protein
MRKLLVLLLAAFLGAMLLVSSSTARGPDSWDYRDPGTAPGGEDGAWAGVDLSVDDSSNVDALWMNLIVWPLPVDLWQETTEEIQAKNISDGNAFED